VTIIADVADINIKDNVAISGEGDAIYLTEGSTLNFNAYAGKGIYFTGGGVYGNNGSVINAYGEGSALLGGENYLTQMSSVGVIGGGTFGIGEGSLIYTQNTAGIYVGGNIAGNKISKILMTNSEVEMFENTSGSGLGSVIYGYRGSIRISSKSKVTIRDNYSSIGGAIYLFLSTITINDSEAIFYRNATNITGSLTPASAGKGGAINVGEYSAIIIENSKVLSRSDSARVRFIENTSDYGGAIYMEGASGLYISESEVSFSANSAKMRGGAIYSEGIAQANNRIIINKSTVGFIDNGIIVNSGTGGGGAITLEKSSMNIIASRVIYENNRSGDTPGVTGGGGGAIAIKDSVLTTDRAIVEFIGNKAEGAAGVFAGALLIKDNSTVKIDNKSDIRFTGNRSFDGGGIGIEDYDPSGGRQRLEISNSKVKMENNTAMGVPGWGYGDGGAIVVASFLGETKLIIKETEMEMIENTAGNVGGGWGLSGPGTTVQILSNSQVRFVDNTALNNGGGIFIDTLARIEGVSNNPASRIEFYGNRSKEGGGIAVEGGSINFKNIYMVGERNIAGINGGLIYVNGGNVSISDLRAKSNEAIKAGGAIYVTGFGVLSIGDNQKEEIIFEDNTANKGAAIYVKEAMININAFEDIIFKDNKGLDFIENKNDIYTAGNATMTFFANVGKKIIVGGGLASEGASDIINKKGIGLLKLNGIIEYDGRMNINNGEVQIKPLYSGIDARIGDVNLAREQSAARNPELTILSDGFDMYDINAKNLNVAGGDINLSINIAKGIHDRIIVADSVTISTSLGVASNMYIKTYGGIGKAIIEIISSQYEVEGKFKKADDYFAKVFGGTNPLFKTKYELKYNEYGNGVYLEVDSKSDFVNGVPGLRHNQREVARVLDSMTEAKKMANIITALSITTLEEYGVGDGRFKETRQLLEKLSGSFLANLMSQGAESNNSVIYNRIREIDAKDNKRKPNMLWGEIGVGGFNYKPDRIEGYDELKSKDLNVTAGASVLKGRNSIGGLYLTYKGKKISQGEDEGNISDINIGVYGGWYDNSGKSNIKANAGLGYQKIDASRVIKYAGYQENPNSVFNTYSLKANIQGEYRIYNTNEIDFKPYIELQNSVVMNSQTRERNAQEAGLIVEGGTYLRSTIIGGIKFEDEKGDFKWFLKGYGGYALIGGIPTYDMKFANGYGKMNSIEAMDLTVKVGIGAGGDIKVSDKINVYGSLNIEAGLDYTGYAAGLGVSYKFGEQITDMGNIGYQERQASSIRSRYSEYKPVNARTFRMLAAWFEVGKYDLTPLAKTMIAEAVEDINKFDYKKITIEGHADPTGSEAKNKTLSIMRARAVYEELYNRGVPLNKMEYIEYFGSQEAIAPNDTEAGRARNRRVELVIDYVIDNESINIIGIEEARERKVVIDRAERKIKAAGIEGREYIGEIIEMPERRKEAQVYIDSSKPKRTKQLNKATEMPKSRAADNVREAMIEDVRQEEKEQEYQNQDISNRYQYQQDQQYQDESDTTTPTRSVNIDDIQIDIFEITQ
jgi:predicted outer membrane repeat protein